MEEDQELKHVCKFCSKSFPCGRSLGGHMRSHMINNNSAETTDVDKFTKKKLSSSVNNNIGSNTNSETPGYGLRENPKKSRRLADSSEEASIYDKLSKESIRKGFLSWKSLVGNMNSSQSEKETRVSNNSSLEDQDSWTSANQKPVLDSQSDNETAAPNRRRRSKRRTRYMTTANSCSLSVANNNNKNNVCSSMSEIEQEQEEVAMCLMMLKRDVGPKAGLNSVAESSDNNSVYLEAKIEAKQSVRSGDEVMKLKRSKEKLKSGVVDSDNFQFEGRQSEYSVSGISRKAYKVGKTEAAVDRLVNNDRIYKSQLQYQFGKENSEVELERNSTNETEIDQAQFVSSKYNSSKRNPRSSFDPELGSDSMKKSTTDASDAEFNKDSKKRSKFECATCNKIFHSYQALGGHRASHKKIKGCFASKIDSSETSIETELSPDPTADSKPIKSINNENSVDHLVADCDDRADTSYAAIKKRHECPICLKVFSSGQALGGHKRSHLINGTEARNNGTIVIEKPIPKIRNFLDLNLPAPAEEESSNGHLGFKQWWIASNHKHEALVGLTSN